MMMSKSSFAVLIACGCLVAALPRLIAPTDTYISDTLGFSQADQEELFYITLQPQNITVEKNNPVPLICQTNISENVSYQWYISQDSGTTWIKPKIQDAKKAIYIFYPSYTSDVLYRCACTYNDVTIYTNPVFVSIVPESSAKGEKSLSAAERDFELSEDMTEETEETEEITEEITEEERTAEDAEGGEIYE